MIDDVAYAFGVILFIMFVIFMVYIYDDSDWGGWA